MVVMLKKISHSVEDYIKFAGVTDIISSLLNKEFRLYIVGGFIRDSLTGVEPGDVDFVVIGNKDRAKNLILSSGKKVLQVRDDTLIKPGLFEVDFVLKNTSENYDPEDVLLKDALERDFTVNAVYVEYPSFNVFDPFNGVKDTKNKLLKPVSNNSVSKSPVRSFRAVRFRVLNGLRWYGVGRQIKELTTEAVSSVPPGRIYYELIRVHESDPQLVADYLRLAHKYGLFRKHKDFSECPLFDVDNLTIDEDNLEFTYASLFMSDKCSRETLKKCGNALFNELSKEVVRTWCLIKTFERSCSYNIAKSIVKKPKIIIEFILRSRRVKWLKNFSKEFSVAENDALYLLKIKKEELGEPTKRKEFEEVFCGLMHRKTKP